MSRHQHVWQLGDITHIVFNLCERSDCDYFERAALAKCMVDGIAQLTEFHACPVYSYCVMPDHVHIVLKFAVEPKIAMRFLKGNSANHLNRLIGKTGQFWQHSTHDEVIKTKEQFLNACFYVWLNPVKAALVTDPAEYAYSNYVQMHKKINRIAAELFPS